MIKILMIPEERKSVLIGKSGRVKKIIEKKTGTRISVKNEVTIEGDGLDVLNAEEIIKSIGRGFSPEKALLLIDEDFLPHIISLSDEKPNTIKRLFARVIGRDGRTRRKIEQKTGTTVSVYGKTVSIIGKAEGISVLQRQLSSCLRDVPMVTYTDDWNSPKVHRNASKTCN